MSDVKDDGNNGKNMESFSKHWVEFFSSKKENGAEFKLDQKVINNIRKWVSPDTTFSQPFAGFTKSSTRKMMETIVASNSRRGKKVSRPLEIKATNYLPLSGNPISITWNNGNFKITSKPFDVNKSNFNKLFGDLNHKIESFRNGGTATHNLTYKRMEFYTEATKIAQIMGRQMFHLERFLAPRDKNTFMFKIDRSYLRLMMALETMHPHTVGVELYNLVNNLVASVRQLQLVFWGLGEKEGSQITSQINELFQGVVRFRNALLTVGKTPVSSDGKTKFDNTEPDAPNEEAKSFRLLLEQNRLAKTLFTNPEINIGILRFLNYNDSVLTSDDFNFKHLENWAFSLIRNCFHLLSNSESILTSESEIKINQELIFNLFQSELEHSNIKKNSYEEAKSRIEHLAKSISEDKAMRIPEIKSIIDDIDLSIEVLSKPSVELLPALVNCLRISPNQINDRIRRQEQIHDVNIAWNNDINRFEIDIHKEEFAKEDRLLSIAIKHNIEPQQLHKSLIDEIQLADDSRKKFNEIMSGLRTSNSVTKDIRVDTRNKMKKSQTNLETRYLEHKTTLCDDLKKEGSNVAQVINQFSQNVNNLLNEFQDEINDLDAGELAKHSEAPGALMIGLGQGGEWIVRATLAKLLNNNSDTRCRNMLKGLNINLKEVLNQYKELDHGFDTAVPRSEKEGGKNVAFSSIFDNANLLAINAGPEQKTMLEQPYNYIWGTRGGKNTKHNQRKDKYLRQSTNAFLIDIGKTGSGGKMGKGRAYSAAAENAIGDTLREKKRGKNIRQVCIVHSFAGGSGSGMILPVLRMVKQSMPGATVWVFSAGETEQGNSTHDAENVVYITSDILQARYNALHFKEKEITLKEWKTYKQQASKLYKELNNSWEKIAPHLKSDKVLSVEDYENEKINAIEELNSLIKDNSDTLKDKFVINQESFDKNFQERNSYDLETEASWTDNVHDWVVMDAEEQQKFYQTVSDPSSATPAREIWKAYFKLLEDKGSFALNPENFDQEMIDKPDSDNVSFNTQYAHLKYIINGIELLIKHKDSRSAIAEIEDKKHTDGQRNYMLIGAEAGINFDEVETSFELPDLMQLFRNYSTTMRKYHDLVIDFYEEIKLSLGAKDDPLVKHIIVSNGHLDVGAVDIAPKRSKKYEIYNSIMVDTFVNLVHSLVENNDDEEHTKIVNSTALNNEVMDLNDMSGRTQPTSNATILSFPELMTASTDFMYNEVDSRTIENDWPYKVIQMVFEDINSPLVNKEIWGTTKFDAPGRVLRALYNNYLRDKNGLRCYKIWDVIESVKEEMISDLLVDKDMFDAFWKNVVAKYDTNLDSKISESRFGREELENSINWMKLLGPRLISYIFETDDERVEFDLITSEWKNIHETIFNDSRTDSPFNEGFRKTTIHNLLKNYGPDMNGSNREMMRDMLFELGIIDGTHLAAIPCSLVYDFAPLILHNSLNYSASIETGNGNHPVRDEDWNYYLPPNQIASTEIQKKIKNPRWKDIQSKWEGSGHDLKRTKLVFASDDGKPVGRYITIKSDFTSPDNVNHIDITPEFMKDFAGIKNKVASEYPEFSNNTVLNKLISVSPNIGSGNRKRLLEEKPEFKTAESDLRVNSIPKSLHDGETESSMILRTILLGNTQRNMRLEALYHTNLPINNSSWFSEIQSSNKQVYGKVFNPKTFDTNLQERFNKFISVEEFDSLDQKGVVGAMMGFMQETMNRIQKPENNPAGNSFNSREYFDELFRNIEESESEFIKDYEEILNKADLENHLFDVKNLISRLTSLCFSAHRQYKFQTNSDSKEYGVAFEFNGTLDASRSLSNNWLWLVNSSETVIASQIEKTINYYHSNFLENPDRIKMKVFIQNIQNGPLCNMTLISQKSGVTEISEKYSELMKMLSKDKFGIIKGPLVHPYSFIRNILWLHTFDYAWVSDPTPVFTRSLQIPDDVILNIFGNPKLIDESESTMSQSGDMKGIDWSKYDVQMWQRAKRYVWKDIQPERDREAYKQRMKFPVHVSDMLLINYLKEYAMEKDKEFSEVFDTPPSDVTEVYPAIYWKTRLTSLAVSSDMKLRNVKSQAPASNGPSIPGFNTGPSGNQNGEKSSVWLKALLKWKEFHETPTD